MFYWALAFLVLALAAGVFGFSGDRTSAGVARMFFGVLLTLFALSMIAQLLRFHG